MSTAAADSSTPGRAARWGLSGDLPWRLLCAAVAGCPWFLENAFNAFWAGLIGLAAAGQRKNLAANLRAMDVPWPGWHAWLAFRRFGSVSVDGIRARTDEVLRWEVRGKEHLDAAMESGLPVVLWTAHMGSYDAAAAFFAERIGRRMHAVRRPERNLHMQALREKNLRDMENPHYTTIYNDSREDGLALELLRVLKAGQWVALQADRALPGLSTFVVEEDGLEWTLPKGPFFLPCAARATCLPVFVHRAGPRSYGVTIHPAVVPRVSRDHQAVTMELGQAWVRLLRAQVRRFPDQWFVFERVVRRCKEGGA